MSDNPITQQVSQEEYEGAIKRMTDRGVSEQKARELLPPSFVKEEPPSDAPIRLDGSWAQSPTASGEPTADLTIEGLRPHPEFKSAEEDARQFGARGRQSVNDTISRLDPAKLTDAFKASGLTITPADVPSVLRQGLNLIHNLIRAGHPPQTWQDVISQIKLGSRAHNVSGDPVPTGSDDASSALDEREYRLQDMRGIGIEGLREWLQTFKNAHPDEISRLEPLSPIEQRTFLLSRAELDIIQRGWRPKAKPKKSA